MVHSHPFVCDTASSGQADWFKGISQKRSRLLCGHRPLQHKGISFPKLAFLICTTPSFVAWQEIKLSGRVLRGQPVELGPARAGGRPRRLPPPGPRGDWRERTARRPLGGRPECIPDPFPALFLQRLKAAPSLGAESANTTCPNRFFLCFPNPVQSTDEKWISFLFPEWLCYEECQSEVLAVLSMYFFGAMFRL